MKIKLLDFADNEVIVDVGDIETVKKMDIAVISGDEILIVSYKDDTEKQFDSCDTRIWNFYDGRYVVYDEDENINLLNDEKFVDRLSSHWFRV